MRQIFLLALLALTGCASLGGVHDDNPIRVIQTMPDGSATYWREDGNAYHLPPMTTTMMCAGDPNCKDHK